MEEIGKLIPDRYKFQLVQNSESNQEYNQKNCINIQRGFCKVCSCNDCRNGQIITRGENLEIHVTTCDCMKKAHSQRIVEQKGLTTLLNEKTFDTYETDEEWKQRVKERALSYVKNWKGNSFIICGESGSGKTHICGAILNEIVKRPVSYSFMEWTTDSSRLKALEYSDHAQYEEALKSFTEPELLYIDDLFKGNEVTNRDVLLAFNIINHRYGQHKAMIVSSEKDLQRISNMNEECMALTGRLYEMAGNGDYVINLKGADKNQRFKAK